MIGWQNKYREELGKGKKSLDQQKTLGCGAL